MTATRRLTAILAADMAGYSRLMRADEEGTLAALNELAPPDPGPYRFLAGSHTHMGRLTQRSSRNDLWFPSAHPSLAFS
jgi:hypothetical protein